MAISRETADQISKALKAVSRGDQQAAVEIVQAIFTGSGECAEGFHVMGLIALQLGDLPRAMELIRGAQERDQNCREYAEVLSVVYAKAARLSDSVYFAKLAAILPAHPVVDHLVPEWLASFEETFLEVEETRHFEDGMSAYKAGNLNLAVEEFQKEAELHPSDPRSWRMLAHIMMRMARPFEAVLVMEGVLSGQDASDQDLMALAMAFSMAGQKGKALNTLGDIASGDGKDPLYLTGKLSILHQNEKPSEKEILTAEERLQAALIGDLKPFTFSGPAIPVNEKLKVGIISGRFRAGAGLDHFWPILINGQGADTRFYCYSHNEFDDVFTRRIGGAVEEFCDLRGVNDRTAATIIHNDGIDLLIDLDGYLDSWHPQLFALQPAPVCIRYLCDVVRKGVLGFSDSYSSPCENDMELQDKDLHLVAAISPESFIPEVPETRKTNRIVGWCPRPTNISDHSLSILKGMIDLVPGIKFRLDLQMLGGVIALDHLEPSFSRAGLLEHIEYYEEEPGQPDFYSDLTLVLDLEGDLTPDHAVEALTNLVPVVSLAGDRQHEQAVTDLLRLFGLGQYAATSEQHFQQIVGSEINRMETDTSSLELIRQQMLISQDRNNIARKAGQFHDRLRQLYIQHWPGSKGDDHV